MAAQKVALSVLLAACAAVSGFAQECSPSDSVCKDVQAEADNSLGLMQIVAGKAAPPAAAKGKAPKADEGKAPKAGEASLVQAKEGATSAHTAKQFPGIGNIINALPDSVTDVIGSVAGSVANTAALMAFATTVNATLQELETKAEALLQQTAEFKDKLLTKVTTKSSEAVVALQETLLAEAGPLNEVWYPITNATAAAAPVITAALQAAGQADLAAQLKSGIDMAMQQAKRFGDALEDLSSLVQEAGNLTVDTEAEYLGRLNATIEAGLATVSDFTSSLGDTLSELITSLAAKLGVTAAAPSLLQAGQAAAARDLPDAQSVIDSLLEQVATLVSTLKESMENVFSGVSEAANVALVEEESGAAGLRAGPALCAAAALVACRWL
mmetsp:Transcript_8160/g.25410  ORF Transcript_8160/g.25410 Transcript_8160/m.25410 type:complete len:384 (+) Transcript_8160:71-1222(+)